MTPIILDCDPGFDDAAALLVLLAEAPERVLGITTVAGNVSLERTQINARAIVDMSGRPVRVYAGCPKPLSISHVDAAHIHGASGIPDADFQSPSCPLQPEHAVDFLTATLEAAAPRSVDLCCVGPLTNLATTLCMRPHLAARINKLVIMGGAIGLGNTTPAAEYNFYADPQAAHAVFAAEIPRVLLPLDTTSAMLFDIAFCDEIAEAGSAAAGFIAERLRRPGHPRFEDKGRPLHDLCAIGYVLWPDLFSGRSCNVAIDTSEGINRGRSVIDYWRSSETANSVVIDEIAQKTFRRRVAEAFSKLP